MNIRIQILIVFIVIIAICQIINMIRKKALELRYALVWLIVGGCILILTIFPRLMDWLAKLMGIASAVNMLFFLGFCFSLAIIFTLTVAISRMSVRIKNLTQELALYEKRQEDSSKLKVDEVIDE